MNVSTHSLTKQGPTNILRRETENAVTTLVFRAATGDREAREALQSICGRVATARHELAEAFPVDSYR